MESFIQSGVLDQAGWAVAPVALALTHITIVSVTVYLHRREAHPALDLHPAVSHFFRFWLWLTTGMVTREWAAVHRKHHAYPTSAKLSSKWYEFDIGWFYIRMPETLGLARVKHVAPLPHFTEPKAVVDPQTLQAVIACRHDVLARYARSIERAYADEMGGLRSVTPQDARKLCSLKCWLKQDERWVPETERRKLAEALPRSQVLTTMMAMRRELAALWGRSAATREQLVKQLQDWCQRAAASGIAALAEFSQRLRRYA